MVAPNETGLVRYSRRGCRRPEQFEPWQPNAAFAATPLMLGNVVLGWIVGGFVADVTFYVFAIFSYERFKALLAVRQPRLQEVDGEPVAAIATE